MGGDIQITVYIKLRVPLTPREYTVPLYTQSFGDPVVAMESAMAYGTRGVRMACNSALSRLLSNRCYHEKVPTAPQSRAVVKEEVTRALARLPAIVGTWRLHRDDPDPGGIDYSVTKTITVRPDLTARIEWDGPTSSPTCTGTLTEAEPGIWVFAFDAASLTEKCAPVGPTETMTLLPDRDVLVHHENPHHRVP